MTLIQLRRFLPVIVLMPVLLLAACADSTPPPAPAKPASLYDRLGGQAAIVAVVDDFVANVAADKRVNRFFRKTNIANLKTRLVEQICQGSGGPCTYGGRTMKDTHKGMGVTDAQFNYVVEDLQKTLNKFNVPAQEQGELLAILGPMRSDIVTAKPAAPAKKKT